ncbi:AmmeMemoRadiSam system protein A [Steroidobacter sp. S1-65]|uniref:AmmeMemoRadiSam system protein A n=1 Tax=Steroidobacter gossypii TaxID=2805490 RepID=A0ABS1WU88_9GAMM|nr:AmmeMemoRadiSam system protein A [Steroidobacter gossypii]MBM0104538.1 AmmeMemoRadiSam system protein A [Steroidobacter gossypii]
MSLGPRQRTELLALARASVEAALPSGELVPAPGEPFDPELDRPGASFVTLRIGEELRGCCGTIEATRPLHVDVWNNAWASAFADPRFPALTPPEWADAGVQISVLSEPQPCDVRSEAELLEILRPGIDGVILRAGLRRSTFLPAVWEQLPDPRRFIRHLKLKAGWPADFWPADMQVLLYTTESFD